MSAHALPKIPGYVIGPPMESCDELVKQHGFGLVGILIQWEGYRPRLYAVHHEHPAELPA